MLKKNVVESTKTTDVRILGVFLYRLALSRSTRREYQ